MSIPSVLPGNWPKDDRKAQKSACEGMIRRAIRAKTDASRTASQSGFIQAALNIADVGKLRARVSLCPIRDPWSFDGPEAGTFFRTDFRPGAATVEPATLACARNLDARSWIEEFGTRQLVPAAAIQGVYNPNYIISAQNTPVVFYWAHRLTDLEAFINSTKRS